MPPAFDEQVAEVAAALSRLDPQGSKTASILRKTFDQLYDGQRTGRYRWDQLYKTEKTHCGTLVEINLQRELSLADGVLLDYRIGGFDVDCKYSQRIGGWMIPPEARGHLCLLISAEDSANPVWSMGIVRASDDLLSSASNRDGKSALNPLGRSAIKWIFDKAPLPPNALLQLPRTVVDAILAPRSGQQRINELFRQALGDVPAGHLRSVPDLSP